MDILAMRGVGLTYQTDNGETPALENININLSPGEFIAVVGPSGCGKTTILSIIAGLIRPTYGTVEIDGKQVTKPCGDVGYMLQRDHLFEWRNIKDNVRLGLEIQHKLTEENKRYAVDLINKYGLKDFTKSFPGQLSGGMRQRAALIRTLAFRPKILLLDEPFSALDFQTRLAVCDDVYRIIREEKKSVILVTHDISEAVSMADRIIVLTTRPGTIKNTYNIDIDRPTPLKRREAPSFGSWFDTIWKEVSK